MGEEAGLMSETATGRTELLRPDGIGRVVVSNEVAAALVEKGFIVIEATELPVTHDASNFGLSVSDEAEEPEEASDSSEGSEEITASSTDVSAVEAIAAITELDDVDAVNAYVEGEERVSVLRAAEELVEDLTGGDEGE
jgi:hypothetical protein